MQNIEETAATAADTITGAVVEAVETATDPVKGARRLERRGAPVNRKLARQAQGWARDTARTAREVVDGTIPQRVASQGLRLVKHRAQRHDVVGDAAYRALELVLGSAAKALGRLEEATQPPARRSGSRPTANGGSRPAARRPATGPASTSRRPAARKAD